MASKKKRHTKLPSKPSKQSPNVIETTAQRASRLASRISKLPDEILASFKSDDPKQRTIQLQGVTSEILFEISPVVSWLERRRPPDTARLFNARLWSIMDQAVQCAGFDIPIYKGGRIARNDEKASPGVVRNCELLVQAKLFASGLADWAEEIEAEDPPQSATIHKVADRTYRVGQSQAVEVSEREDWLLSAFVGRPAMTVPVLAEVSGLEADQIPTVVKRLRQKAQFKDAIRPAGKKGCGGYAATVIDISVQKPPS